MEQRSDWEYFTKTWDQNMAQALQYDWAEIFCEKVQGVLDELMAGNRGALSQFMHRETQRVLGSVPVLRVPGKLGGLGGGIG